MVTERSSLLDNNQEEKTNDSANCCTLTTFTLKRVEVVDDSFGALGPGTTENPSDLEISSLPSPFEIDDFASIRKSLKLKQRPWIVYDQFHNEKKPDVKQHDMCLSPKLCLPKGVTRGCSDCSGCQKDFKDPFKYISSICKQVEPYGLCRIVPPASWKLPCFLEEDDIWQSFKFPTQVQRLDKLQTLVSHRKEPPEHDTKEAKRRKLDFEFSDASAANFGPDECLDSEYTQIESGPDFSLIAFKRYADEFKQCYFSGKNDKVGSTKHQVLWQPSEKQIEGEYWRIVEKPTEEIEVLYGIATIPGKLDCESSVSLNLREASDFVEGCASNWDLMNFYKLPGSLLSFETLESSGLLVPKLHMGMCFSCLPWTVEEHHLYKLQYLHLGAPRIWYSTPGCDSCKFEAIVKKHMSDSTEHIELLQRSVRQLSPGTLKSEGIPVYRCIQRPGEFILFLPGAYHSGFDCGFNCSASVVFAPLEWLPHGLISMELYRENKRKSSISYDKVLLRAANEAVKAKLESLLRGKKSLGVLTWNNACGKDGELANSLRARIRSEARCRGYLSSPSQSRKMDKSFDGDGRKLECSICYYDLYLSAVSCSCSRTKYSCLVHAKHFCSCPWTERTFFFRYQIDELNILAEAVEGKMTAIRTWVKENLGSALHWDKPDEDQNEPLVHPLSTAVKDKVTSEKDEASGFKLLSKVNEPLLEMNLDNSGAKSREIGLKDADDDTSSSSSDIDVEEYLNQLEKSLNSGVLSPVEKGGRINARCA
ncbi:hypothetical protein RDABS01_017959 [Bienertia sinuspersici]